MSSDAYTIWRREERDLRRSVKAPRERPTSLRARRLRLASWLRMRSQLARHQRTVALLALGIVILLFLHLRNHALADRQDYMGFIADTEREALAAIRSGGKLSGVIHGFDDSAALEDKYTALRAHLDKMQERAESRSGNGEDDAPSLPGKLASAIDRGIDAMLDPDNAYHFLYSLLQLGGGIAVVAGLGSLLLGSHVEAFQKLADMFRDSHGATALLVPSVVLGTVAVTSGQVAGSRAMPPPHVSQAPSSAVTKEDLAVIMENIQALQANLESAVAYRAFHRTQPQPVSLWMVPNPPDEDTKAIRSGIDTLKVSLDSALAYHVFSPRTSSREPAWGDPRLLDIDSQMRELTARVATLASAEELKSATDTLAGAMNKDLTVTTALAGRLAIQRLAAATGASPESFVTPQDHEMTEAIHRQLDHLETLRMKATWPGRVFWPYSDPPARACTRGMFSTARNIEACKKCLGDERCVTENVVALSH